MRSLISESWFLSLDPTQQALVELSIRLYEREVADNQILVDYSFVLFPMSKAYEGFLKKYLFDIQIINLQQYESKRFRIGRALNPDISDNHRDEHWLFDDVSRKCGDEVAREIWQTWLECRNRVFHYFPDQKTTLELAEVSARMKQVIQAMRSAFACKINTD
jgi:hypothetical protein